MTRCWLTPTSWCTRLSSVFWFDYYNNALARAGTPNGIDALIAAHHRNAGGDSQILHVDPDLYIMQRAGLRDDHAQQSGLIYVLNNLGDKWSGTTVKTKWKNQRFVPVAWTVTTRQLPTNALRTGSSSEFPAPPAAMPFTRRHRLYECGILANRSFNRFGILFKRGKHVNLA